MPTNRYLGGGDQFGGGYLVGANTLGFGQTPTGATDMIGTFAFGAIGST